MKISSGALAGRAGYLAEGSAPTPSPWGAIVLCDMPPANHYRGAALCHGHAPGATIFIDFWAAVRSYSAFQV